jgi:hypothetical protein
MACGFPSLNCESIGEENFKLEGVLESDANNWHEHQRPNAVWN